MVEAVYYNFYSRINEIKPSTRSTIMKLNGP